MSWMAYKIVLRLLASLHVGAGSLGNVQRTRPYLTGKALWGALTARLTRDDSTMGGDYGAVGRRVNDELAFSYFYPAVGAAVGLWPWDEAGEFAWRYLGSYTGTALDYSRNAAEEGSLHETEFIAATTRDGQPVHLVGYIFEQAGCSLPWRAALSRLQLGGERTYGWGRMAPAAITPANGPLFGCWEMDLDADRPVCRADQETRLLAHALADGPQAVAGLAGPVEPLVGRETAQARQHGERLAAAAICWAPGAAVPAGVTVQIGPYGIWQAAPRLSR